MMSRGERDGQIVRRRASDPMELIPQTVSRHGGEVLVAGYYGYGNTGDESILAALLGDLGNLAPPVTLSVMSGNPGQTASQFGVRAVPWSDPLATMDAVERAALVVIGGGGLFHDYWGVAPDSMFTAQNWGIGLYSALALFAAVRQKPIMLWVVGIGPLSSEAARTCVKSIAQLAIGLFRSFSRRTAGGSRGRRVNLLSLSAVVLHRPRCSLFRSLLRSARRGAGPRHHGFDANADRAGIRDEPVMHS